MADKRKRFGFFVLWHINLCRLFDAKAILREEQLWYYLTHIMENKGVHIFPKGVCPKVNVIARLEQELTYYDSTVHLRKQFTLLINLRNCYCISFFIVENSFSCYRFFKTFTKFYQSAFILQMRTCYAYQIEISSTIIHLPLKYFRFLETKKILYTTLSEHQKMSKLKKTTQRFPDSRNGLLTTHTEYKD